MPLIPVAWPQIQDLTLRGELDAVKGSLARLIADDLGLSGVFKVRPSEAAPTSSLITWNSAIAFDYLGWRRAGAWLVVVGEVSPSSRGLRVRFDGYLTEEADILRIGGSQAIVQFKDLARFAHGYVNAVLRCITGLPGAFGSRIAYSFRPRPGASKEVFYIEYGSRKPVQVSRDGIVAMLPAWSMGGGVAFTGFRRGNPDTYIADCPGCPGGKVRALSSRQGMNSGIAYSPDGKSAALTLAPDGNPDIYLIDPETGDEQSRLTSAPSIDTSPCWSPDGKRIAFVSDRMGGPQIWIMRSDGTEKRPLPLPGYYNTSPDWSPDGAEIVFQTRGEGSRFSIRVYNLKTGGLRYLTGSGDCEEPSFSPDGRMIVFTRKDHGQQLLWIMTRDGLGARPLMEGEGDYFTPAWERSMPVGGQ
ncbi:MAG: hypothetical protein GXP54_01990 [Deltaproteobacteria bacterium]|nr:hypothetical protein [Deltaproteobacteria bacterium]